MSLVLKSIEEEAFAEYGKACTEYNKAFAELNKARIELDKTYLNWINSKIPEKEGKP